MLIRPSQLRAFSIFALLITLYLSAMAVTHQSNQDDTYHIEHQCELYSGLQQGLISTSALPNLFPVTTTPIDSTKLEFQSRTPFHSRARSPPAFLRTLT